MRDKILLSESEVKVALREYVEKNIKTVKEPWGFMALTVDGKRMEEAKLIFTESLADEEE
jgi:hypothetical protein